MTSDSKSESRRFSSALTNDMSVGTLALCLTLAMIAGMGLSISLGRFDPHESLFDKPTGRYSSLLMPLRSLATFLLRFKMSMKSSTYPTLVLMLVLTWVLLHAVPTWKTREMLWILPLSFLAAFSLVLCESFHAVYSWDLVFETKTTLAIALSKALGLTVFFVLTIKTAESLSIRARISGEAYKSSSVLRTAMIALVLLLCWLPYMLSLYPGTIVPDVNDQVAQLLGNVDHCRSIRRTIQVRPDVLLNNHHPVAHTLLIGLTMKLGEILGSSNKAFYIHAIVQSILLAHALASQVSFIEERCECRWPSRAALLFFALNPIFPCWGMTITKDVPFIILTWWVCKKTYDLVQPCNEYDFRKGIAYGILLLVWMLSRNNCVYIIVALIPFALWHFRTTPDVLRRFILSAVISVLVFQVGIQGIVFSMFGISKGGKQEALSVPFMQTARLIRDHPEAISADEEEVLLHIFKTKEGDLKEVANRYDARPTKADDVKFMFDNDNGTDYLSQYLKIWFKGLKEHPLTYIQAVMCLDYSWLSYESHEDNRVYIGVYDTKDMPPDWFGDLLPDIHNVKKLETARSIVRSIIDIVGVNPLTSWLVEHSFYTWVYLILFVFTLRHGLTRERFTMEIILLNFCICFLGPVSYMRYALPAVVCLPFFVVLVYTAKSNNVKETSPSDQELISESSL